MSPALPKSRAIDPGAPSEAGVGATPASGPPGGYSPGDPIWNVAVLPTETVEPTSTFALFT